MRSYFSMRSLMVVVALLFMALIFTPSNLHAQDTVVVAAQTGKVITPPVVRVTNQFNEAVTVYVGVEDGSTYRLGEVEAGAITKLKFKGYMMNLMQTKNIQFTLRPRGGSDTFKTNAVMNERGVEYWLNVGSPLTSTYVVVK